MVPESHHAVAFKNVVKRKKKCFHYTPITITKIKKCRQYQVLTRMWNNGNSYISGGNAKCQSHSPKHCASFFLSN